LRAGLGHPAAIYVLDGFTEGAGARLAAANLTPVLCSRPQIEAASAFAAGQSMTAAIQVDTGMNRQGLTVAEVRDLAANPPRGLRVETIMSHLGSATDPADPRSAAQLEAFAGVRSLFPEARASFAASAGIALGHVYHFDIVRPGISLYGGGPEERPDARLKAVATFEAPILYVRQVGAGEMIGYGSTTIVEADSRVAVVAAGYADGLIRGAMGRSQAWFAGALRKVLIVTMDLIAIEIGDAAAAPGDMVELLGPRVLLDDLAAAAGTVAHECLVRLGGRAERVYLGAR